MDLFFADCEIPLGCKVSYLLTLQVEYMSKNYREILANKLTIYSASDPTPAFSTCYLFPFTISNTHSDRGHLFVGTR